MRRYPSKEDNLRMYKVLTAHEAGHLEYGTYDLSLSRLADLAAQAGLRYGRASASPPTSLEEFFQLYPHPLLIRDLWMMAEDARIEACLKAEYPGLGRDMDAVAREEVARRSLTHGMSVRELVVELLLQMSATDPDEVRVPDALADVVERAWALLRVVASPQATAEDVIRAVHRAYVLIEELTAKELPTPPDGDPEDSSRPLQPRAGEEQGGAYRPMTTFAHRGVMDAARVREPEQGVGGQADEPSAPALEISRGEPSLSGGSRSQQEPFVLRDAASVPSPVEGRPSASLTDDARVITEEEAGAASPALPGLRAFLYDEWDGRIQDYRTRWCRVVEQTAPEGTEEFIGLVRSRYGGVVSLIRRYFEGIRPPALRRMRRQADGEEVGIDAVRPLVQNRDGAAIRRALRRLSARAAKVKLLVMLSDGRPLDDAYQEEYALEDTKAALREAKALGVHPFCITVDREARGYLERMYGDVCYLIIDRVESLPERLPRIYKALTT